MAHYYVFEPEGLSSSLSSISYLCSQMSHKSGYIFINYPATLYAHLDSAVNLPDLIGFPSCGYLGDSGAGYLCHLQPLCDIVALHNQTV